MAPVVPTLAGYCPDVEVLDCGSHRGDEYTVRDLREMVRNFMMTVGKGFDPPVVIGHEEDQPLVRGLVENTGSPAVGWVTALRVATRAGADGKRRPVLLADLHGIHPEIAALVNARQYRKVSPEIYPGDALPEDAPPGVRGMMLRRLSLLGGELPQIRTLRDLPAVRFAEAKSGLKRVAFLKRTGRERSADGKAWLVFSEVTAMADDSGGGGAPDLESVVDDLITSQPVTLTPDIVANLSPDVKAQIAATLTPGGGETPAEPAATPMAEWPEGVTRESATADLLALGDPAITQESLDMMSDDELLALWQEKVGGAVPMSEKKKGGVAPAITPKQFSELRTLLAQVPAVRRQVASLAADTARRKKAEREQTVRAYCERWVREGKITAYDKDEKSTRPNLFSRLVDASGERVKKYGEASMSDFDAQVAEIEDRPRNSAARFGERVPDPHKGAQGDELDTRIDAYAERRNKFRRVS